MLRFAIGFLALGSGELLKPLEMENPNAFPIDFAQFQDAQIPVFPVGEESFDDYDYSDSIPKNEAASLETGNLAKEDGYFSSRINSVIDGNILAVGHSTGIEFYDVSNKKRITFLSLIELKGTTELVMSDGTVFAYSKDTTTEINVKNPTHPFIVNSWSN